MSEELAEQLSKVSVTSAALPLRLSDLRGVPAVFCGLGCRYISR